MCGVEWDDWGGGGDGILVAIVSRVYIIIDIGLFSFFFCIRFLRSHPLPSPVRPARPPLHPPPLGSPE